MPNSILTIDMITRELMLRLENNLTFTKYVNRNYNDHFAMTGAKIGDVVTIRLPPFFVGRTGRVINIEPLTEQSIALTLDTQYGVDLDFTSKDMLLSIDDFGERLLQPAAANIANKIDRDGLALYNQIFSAAGTPGSSMTFLQYLNSGALLDEQSVPRDGLRSMVIGPRQQANIVDVLKGLFHSSTEIEEQYKQGTMGLTGGYKWSMDQNIANHTVGALGGTPLVNGASQTGASLITDGWTASVTNILLKGDIFTVTGVNSVNPMSKGDNGQLQQFVVTANQSSSAGGAVTIPISPSITTSGAYQTVTASPADNAALTILGTAATVYNQGMAFHRDAFVLGTADLPLPMGTHQASRISDDQLGISVRMIWDYDVTNDLFVARTDVLYGWVVARPQMACRIVGN